MSHTPFSTKHGVKGAEFDNVLVVLGRGWNLYNWGQLLTWLHTTCLANRIGALERNRNLFYVACSRPKRNLTVLITQHLSDESLALLIIVTQSPLEN
ncbi:MULTISPECIES: 3'-5' exonuclease [Vibrio]|uniref:3'-5' exonuclease n=1 Tax=Vibrio diabolicus TaxID=50719 RepID=UPI0038CD5891